MTEDPTKIDPEADPQAQDEPTPVISEETPSRRELSTLLLGMGLGIVFTLVAYVVLSLEAIKGTLLAVSALTLSMSAGALLSHFIYKRGMARVQGGSQDIRRLFGTLKELGLSLKFPSTDGDLLKNRQVLEQKISEVEEQIAGLSGTALAFFASVRMFGWVAGLATACGSVALFAATYMQVQRLDTQIDLLNDQNRIVNVQNVLLEADRRSSLNVELTSILESVDRFLGEKDDLEGEAEAVSLPARLNGRIVALSRALRPYKVIDVDGTLAAEATSPERGHLLLALLSAKIDMSPIIELGADFSRADFESISLQRIRLPGAILDGIDLRGIRADEAVFNGASLLNADFSETYFLEADLSGATLDHANLSGSEFRRVDLSQASLRFATLHAVNFVKADLNSADLLGATLTEAGLAMADLRDANLKGTNLKDAVLRDAKLPDASQLNGAELVNVDFQGASVPDPGWLKQLAEEGFTKGFEADRWELATFGEGETVQYLVVSSGDDEND